MMFYIFLPASIYQKKAKTKNELILLSIVCVSQAG